MNLVKLSRKNTVLYNYMEEICEILFTYYT